MKAFPRSVIDQFVNNQPGIATIRRAKRMTTTTTGLAGKVALVTGGSRGIGAAIARRLARDGAADAVTYNASPEKAEEVVPELQAAGRRALAVRADSADVGAVRTAVTTTAQTFGRLQALVNNAGILVHRTADQ